MWKKVFQLEENKIWLFDLHVKNRHTISKVRHGGERLICLFKAGTGKLVRIDGVMIRDSFVRKPTRGSRRVEAEDFLQRWSQTSWSCNCSRKCFCKYSLRWGQICKKILKAIRFPFNSALLWIKTPSKQIKVCCNVQKDEKHHRGWKVLQVASF